MERASQPPGWCRSLAADLDRRPADLILSVFATGATGGRHVKVRSAGAAHGVLCTY